MLISRKWLNDYVELSMPLDEVIDRLTMSGLNHDGTEAVGSDLALDIEVTSNRADCLGHIGIAREVATLFNKSLRIPEAQPQTNGQKIDAVCRVSIENPDVCLRYTARIIKGVKIGPSPAWMQERLTTLGIGIVNNIVDITNYVMFECGQPLHAFDYQRVQGQQIIVRDAKAGEKLVAIDHREYALTEDMCVIADVSGPLALGGVMGGADSEVSETTTEVLIEAAYFEQLSIRNTARALNLHSPSSFRFERDVDSANLDWASRRCCQLILEIAGGELLEGVVDVGRQAPTPAPIQLRYSQIRRILGIEIPRAFVAGTLKQLGLTVHSDDSDSITVSPPHWRKDLSREVDLIEEVGRIYGYDKVPDNAVVPLAASYCPTQDQVLNRVRQVLTVAGFDEAVTASLVPQPWSDSFSPWTDSRPLKSSQPMLGVLEKASQNIGAVEWLRRSLIPSLLEVRRINDYRSNDQIELFETAKVYLPVGGAAIPDQPAKVALASERDYGAIKGVVESLVAYLNPSAMVSWNPYQSQLLDFTRSGELWVNNLRLGVLGEVSPWGRKLFGLRNRATVCELDLAVLTQISVLTRRHQDLSQFPPVSRDFNFVMLDSVSWVDLESSVREVAHDLLEQVHYRETFRDEQKDGPGKKRILFSVVLRSPVSTLTSQQVDELSQRIVKQFKSCFDAELV